MYILPDRKRGISPFLKCVFNLQVSVNSLPLTVLVLPEGFVSHSDSVIDCKGRKTAGIYAKPDEKQLLTLTLCHLENVTLKKGIYMLNLLSPPAAGGSHIALLRTTAAHSRMLHSASNIIGGVTEVLKVNRLCLLPEQSLSKRH